jgi:hypothetical protein
LLFSFLPYLPVLGYPLGEVPEPISETVPVGPTWLGELAVVEWVGVTVLSVAGAVVLGAGALAGAAAT